MPRHPLRIGADLAEVSSSAIGGVISFTRAQRFLRDHAAAAALVMSDFVRGTRLCEFVPILPSAALLPLAYCFFSGRRPLARHHGDMRASWERRRCNCAVLFRTLHTFVPKHSTIAVPPNPFTLWQHLQSLKNPPRHRRADAGAGGRVKAN